MKIALCQISPVAGNIPYNLQRITSELETAAASGAHLAVFTELCVTGYPPRDLLDYPEFIREAAAAQNEIHAVCRRLGIHAIVGTIAPNIFPGKKALCNAAVHLSPDPDTPPAITYKKLLPTYDVFDEHRYFEEAPPDHVPPLVLIPIPGEQPLPLGVTICEDIWNDNEFWKTERLYPVDPIDCLIDAGARAIINISASPFIQGKPLRRLEMLKHIARRRQMPIILVNQVGGNDQVVFDGGSCVVLPNGEMPAAAGWFCEKQVNYITKSGKFSAIADANLENSSNPAQTMESEKNTFVPAIADTNLENGANASASNSYEKTTFASAIADTNLEKTKNDLFRPIANEVVSIISALRLGLHDYMARTGFTQVIVGNSGGIDSAVVLALAVHTLGPQNVISVTMPGEFTTTGTHDDAGLLAKNLDIRHIEAPISAVHQQFTHLLANPDSQVVQKLFSGDASRMNNIAEENVQARIRGNILMYISNSITTPRTLLLTTGNKSELAVGYCTLYGDMCGGLALISDVPKMMVYKIARELNAAMNNPIPQSIIDREPSAELAPGQKDQDSLPPYPVLDEIIRLFVEEHASAEDIVTAGIADDPTVRRIIRLIETAEYKRAQAAPGIKVTSKAFGVGRRIPIARGTPP